ncbi:MAG: peptidoglycan-binding domain-containing protein [Wujia sp.]|nr:peptidoglycan-binding domain-containing protein [Wujia sp.]MCI6240662.1 peptidoglycan-binding protein [Clostridium sp.]MDY3728213.1 peptidoglycan-binding domain-containing protein [Wujia sp.]
MDQFSSDTGYLNVIVTGTDNYSPLSSANIEIADTGNPNRILESITTNQNGQTGNIELSAPPREYSMMPTDNQPYSEYNLKISAPGYQEGLVSGVQIFSGENGLQSIVLQPSGQTPGYVYNPIVIGGHTLWEYYPPKIAEPEIKPLAESGEIVLSRVVVPETIVVHDGAPGDSTATDYYVPYIDYIKNVACCEIYSTWPESTIEANILAIMSFTLNRVYTEWYRNKGYNFTITSSTAYDHKWIYGKTIYENISQIADRLYNRYLARPNVKQPILTQYCDGKRVSCPNWMTQWGSKALGDDGFSAIDIIHYYYGSDMYVNEAEIVSGIPSSYPGYDLTIGSSGEPVITIQEQLNRIAENYPAIPTVTVDGIYGTATAEAVRTFQRIFQLPASGIVDFPTWYKISQIYVGVSKIAENII